MTAADLVGSEVAADGQPAVSYGFAQLQEVHDNSGFAVADAARSCIRMIARGVGGFGSLSDRVAHS